MLMNRYAKTFLSIIAGLVTLATMATGNSGANDIEYIEKKTIALQEELGTSGPWHATAYEAKDIDNWDYFMDRNAIDRPARLCFSRTSDKEKQQCYPAMNTCAGPAYTFQFFNDMKVIQLQRAGKPQYGVLFTAENRGYHLGFALRILRFFSIWAYDETTGNFKQALQLFLTEQGEFQYILPRPERLNGVAVAADFIWGENDDGRYAKHRYALNIYRLTESGTYKWMGAYETKNKYESLADSDASVIEQELSNIEKYVRNHREP